MFKEKLTILYIVSVEADNALELFIVFSVCPRGPFMRG